MSLRLVNNQDDRVYKRKKKTAALVKHPKLTNNCALISTYIYPKLEVVINKCIGGGVGGRFHISNVALKAVLTAYSHMVSKIKIYFVLMIFTFIFEIPFCFPTHTFCYGESL